MNFNFLIIYLLLTSCASEHEESKRKFDKQKPQSELQEQLSLSKVESMQDYWSFGDPKEKLGAWVNYNPRGDTFKTKIIKPTRESKTESTLWFRNDNWENGKWHLEVFRNCDNKWIYLDKFDDRKIVDGEVKISDRPVVTYKAEWTNLGDGKTYDLILPGGIHDQCAKRRTINGNEVKIGQPYLRWKLGVSYRLKVWAYMANNPQFRFYWEVEVKKPHFPGKVTGEDNKLCLAATNEKKVITMNENWWSNFKQVIKFQNGEASLEEVVKGQWDLGSGPIANGSIEKLKELKNPNTKAGWPTGEDTTFGRRAYHAKGNTPYYFAHGSNKGLDKIGMCTIEL